MLKGLPYPWPIAEIILQHHENVDGSGYPNGLKGNEMLLEAKILRVADTVVAMLSHRPYRSRYTLDEVLKELTEKNNAYYDNKVVNACIELFQNEKFSFVSKEEYSLVS
jgi:HD-GYP domain-containing protein (c-di-GMP phosphodiesterase class II)